MFFSDLSNCKSDFSVSHWGNVTLNIIVDGIHTGGKGPDYSSSLRTSFPSPLGFSYAVLQSGRCFWSLEDLNRRALIKVSAWRHSFQLETESKSVNASWRLSFESWRAYVSVSVRIVKIMFRYDWFLEYLRCPVDERVGYFHKFVEAQNRTELMSR